MSALRNSCEHWKKVRVPPSRLVQFCNYPQFPAGYANDHWTIK